MQIQQEVYFTEKCARVLQVGPLQALCAEGCPVVGVGIRVQVRG